MVVLSKYSREKLHLSPKFWWSYTEYKKVQYYNSIYQYNWKFRQNVVGKIPFGPITSGGPALKARKFSTINHCAHDSPITLKEQRIIIMDSHIFNHQLFFQNLVAPPSPTSFFLLKTPKKAFGLLFASVFEEKGLFMHSQAESESS